MELEIDCIEWQPALMTNIKPLIIVLVAVRRASSQRRGKTG
jgi:hypothetical protein